MTAKGLRKGLQRDYGVTQFGIRVCVAVTIDSMSDPENIYYSVILGSWKLGVGI